VTLYRYDGRGHLHDLSKFDTELIQTTALSEEERHIEALCDEERYLELNTDILEKMLYEGLSYGLWLTYICFSNLYLCLR